MYINIEWNWPTQLAKIAKISADEYFLCVGSVVVDVGLLYLTSSEVDKRGLSADSDTLVRPDSGQKEVREWCPVLQLAVSIVLSLVSFAASPEGWIPIKTLLVPKEKAALVSPLFES